MINSQSLSQQFKASALVKIEKLIDDANCYFGASLDVPSLSFRRSGANAGTAHLQKNKINLNPIYALENQQEFLSQVIPHEVAHIVAFQIYGKVKPHGKEWQSIMKVIFKCEPKTRHAMETSEPRTNSVLYYCHCGDVELSIRRHNKVQRGEQKYQCRKCNQILTEKS